MRISDWSSDVCSSDLLLQLRLVGIDLRRVGEGEADVVEAVEQTVLAEGIDLERYGSAVGTGDLLLLQVDRDHGVGAALRVVHQQRHLLLRQGDRQDAVLEAVVVEDVGEGWRDDAADAEVQERPGRVLARGAAAEIFQIVRTSCRERGCQYVLISVGPLY